MKIKIGKLYHSPSKEICLMPTAEAASKEYCYTSGKYAAGAISFYTDMYGSAHLIPHGQLFVIIEEMDSDKDVVKVLYRDKIGYLSCVNATGIVKEYCGKRNRKSV